MGCLRVMKLFCACVGCCGYGYIRVLWSGECHRPAPRFATGYRWNVLWGKEMNPLVIWLAIGPPCWINLQPHAYRE